MGHVAERRHPQWHAPLPHPHWLFDNGLWSLADDYTVLVAERHFAEAGDAAMLLTRMRGRRIALPANPRHRPAAQHLAWHRHHRFLGN